MVSAVLSRSPERTALRLSVGPHDVLFGWGLASVISQPVELASVPVPRFGYLHFLFPGLLLLSMSTSTVIGARRSVRRRLGMKSMAIAAGALGRAGLGLLQIALLIVLSKVLFKLPLSAEAALWLTAISLAGILAFSGIGFALACSIELDSTLLKLVLVLQLPLVLLSDCVFLLGDLPHPLQKLGERLPTTYLVHMLRQVLLDGSGNLRGTLLAFAVAVAICIAGFALGLRLLDGRRRPALAPQA